MSASERLKALERRWNTSEFMDARQDLVDALPELIAVVEAAEKERARDLVALASGLPEKPITEDFERWAQSPEARARDLALAALDAKLANE